MTDSLRAFFNDIHKFEDDWYARHGTDRRIVGSTIWDANRDELRAIEEHHGVCHDDPRVYSITGYRREVQLIEAEWLSTCRGAGWTAIARGSPEFQEYWEAYIRFSTRLDDCRGRHFPRLSTDGTVSSSAGLWAYITEIAIPVIESLNSARNLAGKRDGPDPELQHVYLLMHEMKLSWAPEPPYPFLTEQETIDALRRIANRLEREDEEHYTLVTGWRSAVVKREPSHDTALLEQWKFALANWKESLQTIRGRLEAINLDYPDLYALQRSWPADQAQPLHHFLMSRCRFEEIQFADFCPNFHELSSLLPVHGHQLPLSGVYIYREGNRYEAIFLYGSIAGWQRFHQVVHELMNLITMRVRGYVWPFSEKPSFIDMSTWTRLVFDACYRGQLPCVLNRLFERDDETQEGFFQTKAIQLTAISAQAMNPLILAVDRAVYPGPKLHSWPTALIRLDDTIGFESVLIWQPLTHRCGLRTDGTAVPDADTGATSSPISDFPVKGRFHIVLKGEVALYLNGRKLRYDPPSRPAMYAITQEITLREGDIVVMRLSSVNIAYRSLRGGFVSADKQTVLPFRIEHVRRVDGVPIDTIDAHAIGESHIGVVDGRPDGSRKREWDKLALPLADSEWMWGPERNKHYQLAFVVESSKLKRVSTGIAGGKEGHMFKRFAVALSFPGEHRDFVLQVAEALAANLTRERVFYDEWFEAELLGAGGDLKLQSMYEQAELVIPFFSRYYDKPWCSMEWETIRGILLNRRKDDAVIPVHLDDTEVAGWSAVNFGIRLRGRTSQQIADVILQALATRIPNLKTSSASTARPVTPSPLMSVPPSTPGSPPGALAVWRETLDYLQQQEVITADGGQKFAIKKQIKECKQKIRELGAKP